MALTLWRDLVLPGTPGQAAKMKNISNKIKTCLADNQSIEFAVFTCGGACRGRSRDPVQRSRASGTCFPLKRAAREKEREIISESHKYHQRRLLFSGSGAAIALVTRLIWATYASPYPLHICFHPSGRLIKRARAAAPVSASKVNSFAKYDRLSESDWGKSPPDFKRSASCFC